MSAGEAGITKIDFEILKSPEPVSWSITFKVIKEEFTKFPLVFGFLINILAVPVGGSLLSGLDPSLAKLNDALLEVNVMFKFSSNVKVSSEAYVGGMTVGEG
tara:strand:+ start:347 stop:652 length:306 start_codon:yes stop_codon:yes gene_type:complete